MYLIALVICVTSILACFFIQYVPTSSSNEILEEQIRKENYTLETHTILTEDQYLLTVHRIPGDPGSVPVYIQHGLLSSSADWFMAGKNKALPFILSDNGFDVWLGNVRGNQFSLKHKKLSPSDSKFWDFSWSEVGYYDVSAIISYISSKTKKDIYYVGHSMGCTTFSVMASERPDVAKKVRAMVALAPATFEYHVKQPVVRALSKVWQEFQSVTNFIGMNRFGSRNFIFDFLGNLNSAFPNINYYVNRALFWFVDAITFAPEQRETVPNWLQNFPSGTSVKLFTHWLQQMTVNEFQKFDYGAEKNIEIYGSKTPPKYDLSKVRVPVSVFYSDSDLVTAPEDVENFYNQLPLKNGIYKIDNLSHGDFKWRDKAVKLVFYKILSIFK